MRLRTVQIMELKRSEITKIMHCLTQIYRVMLDKKDSGSTVTEIASILDNLDMQYFKVVTNGVYSVELIDE